jgi:hypothetical protein
LIRVLCTIAYLHVALSISESSRTCARLLGVAFAVLLSSRAVSAGTGSPPRVDPGFAIVLVGSSRAFQASVPNCSIGPHGRSTTPGAPLPVLFFSHLAFLVDHLSALFFPLVRSKAMVTGLLDSWLQSRGRRSTVLSRSSISPQYRVQCP